MNAVQKDFHSQLHTESLLVKVSEDLIIIWSKGQFLEFLLEIPAVLDSVDYSSNFANISSPGSEDTAVSELPPVSLVLFLHLFAPPGLPYGFPGDPRDNLPAMRETQETRFPSQGGKIPRRRKCLVLGVLQMSVPRMLLFSLKTLSLVIPSTELKTAKFLP